jgi:tripartite-type tricarboxylate transporter receptor subunit TctC
MFLTGRLNMLKSKILKVSAIAVISITCMFVGNTSHAQSPAEFYKGKTVTFLVPYPPGGSYDVYGRLVAAHMGKHIPGKPNIIVQNMGGGGGTKGTNYSYRSGAKDGTFLLWPFDAYATSQLLNPKRVKYDASKFTSLGSIVPVNPVVMVRAGAPAKTLDAVKRTEVIVGCTSRNSQSFIMPAMQKYFLGLKFKLICGYKGSAPLTLALERKEVDVQSSAWASWRIRHADRISKRELTPLVQVGLTREKELPNVPLMQELTSDPKAKRVLEFVSSGSAIGRSLAAPPGVPADRIAALRTAFNAVVKDPGLLADAKKRRALVIPKKGEEVQSIVVKILATAPELVKEAKAAWTQKPGKCKVNCKKKKKKK